jgi:hypothetical protein
MADASEGFLFTRLIDALKVAEDCCRGIAITRADERYMVTAKILGQIQDNAKKLAHASARQALHILGEKMAHH